jgi:hypothetical protein
MAKYAPSALLGRISRSAGSTTFGHNRYGAYFRNRVIPTNPVTPAQTAVRVDFGDHSSAYRELTQNQQDEWIAYGLNFSRQDSLGQTYTLTGLQAFVSVNRNLATYGAAALQNPGAYAPPIGLATATATADDTPTLSVAYTATPLGSGVKLFIFATRPLSAGINFQPNGAYKLITVTAAAAASPANILTAYVAVYGSVGVAGDKILFKAFTVNPQGLASPVLQFSAIVAAI